MNRIIILIVTILIAIVSCNKDNRSIVNSSNLDSIDVSYSILCQEILNGHGGFDFKQIVIKDDSNWNGVLMKMSDTISNSKYPCTLEKIDFHEHIIIAIFDSIRNTYGSSIDVKSIIETKNNIIINIYKKRKFGLSPAISQPFCIFRIPYTNKPIRFTY